MYIQQRGDQSNQPGLINIEMEIVADQHNRGMDAQPHADNMATTKLHVSERVKSAIILNGADLSRHTHFNAHSEASYKIGRAVYPANTAELLAMMNNFQQQEITRYVDSPRMHRRDKDQLNFAHEKGE